MTIRGSASVTKDLARVYPEETVVAQLKRLYRSEINRAIEEASGLLPQYRGRVDATTYARDHAKLLLVAAYLHDNSMSVHALEKSLKYVLKQQQVFTGVLSQPA